MLFICLMCIVCMYYCMVVMNIIINNYYTIHAGSVNCLLVKDAPCGGRMEEMPMTTFM